MNPIYNELATRIRDEIPNLEHVIQRALQSWVKAQELPDEGAYLDSVALNLHSFYSGLERLFELTVISQSNALVLDEFRRFRHLVRNVYTMNLVPDKIAGLISVLPELWSGLRAELLAFADFLEDLAQVGGELRC